jgi:hypothetical protein
MTAPPIVAMPVIPWPDVDHGPGISVIVVRIRISVAVGMIPVAVPISDGHADPDSNPDTGICLRSASEGESADGHSE